MIRADHMRLIRSIAWSFHFTTGLPFEDLYSETCLIYCNAMEGFREKERRSKRTTYLYKFITNQLIFYAKDEYKRKSVIWELEYRKDACPHTPHYEYFEPDLPPDVFTVMEFVRNGDPDLSQVAPKIARGIVFRHLRGIGWTHRRAWDAIRETRKHVTQT